MSQIVIYEFLKTQRLLSDEFFTPIEIYNGCERKFAKTRLYGCLIQLENYNYLDVKRKGKLTDFKRAYRLKKKYVEKQS